MEYLDKTVYFLRSLGVHYGWAIGLAALALVIMTRRRWLPHFPVIEQKCSQFLALDSRNVLILTVLPILLFGFYALLVGQPVPVNHDEFCYLLAGETYAAGRLTNPTPVLWQHFETIFQIMEPTYMGKYPPAQGLAIASGIVLLNSPIFGIWLSGALAILAIYWMLRALFPSSRAFLGAFILLTQYTFFIWSQNYFGGYLALLGGALTLGAVLRFERRMKIQIGIAFGLGLAVLSNSRPFEGLVFSILVILGWMIFVRESKIIVFLKKSAAPIILPTALILIANFGWMGYSNLAVTGNVFKLPYALHTEKYYPIPLFIFQSVRPFEQYNHLLFEKVNRITLNLNEHETIQPRYFFNQLIRLIIFLPFGLTNNPFFLLAWLLALWWARDNRQLQFLLFVIAGMMLLIGILVNDGIYPFYLPHYYAPLYAIQITLVLLILKKLFINPKLRTTAIVLTVSLLVGQTAMLTLLAAKESYQSKQGDRQKIVQFLNQTAGTHLVLVDYSLKSNSSDEEWLNLIQKNTNFVYNSPNIDAAKIVWANNMSRVDNQEIFAYYPERKIWIVGFDRDNVAQIVSCSNLELPETVEIKIKLLKFCPN